MMTQIQQAEPRRAAKTTQLTGGIIAITIALVFLLKLALEQKPIFNQVLFSNDGPLGAMMAQQNRMPAILTGLWQNLNWLGNEAPAPSPTVSSALRLITSPLGFSR